MSPSPICLPQGCCWDAPACSSLMPMPLRLPRRSQPGSARSCRPCNQGRIGPLAQPAPLRQHQGWAWTRHPGRKSFVPPASSSRMPRFGVPGVGFAPSTSSWLPLGTPAHVPPSQVQRCVGSEGAQRWRQWEALGWDGTWIPSTPSPFPTATAHGRLQLQVHPAS